MVYCCPSIAPPIVNIVQGWDLTFFSRIRDFSDLDLTPISNLFRLQNGPSEGNPKDGHFYLVSRGGIAIDCHGNQGWCR